MIQVPPELRWETDEALTVGWVPAAHDVFLRYRGILADLVEGGHLDPSALRRFDLEQSAMWDACLAVVEAGERQGG